MSTEIKPDEFIIEEVGRDKDNKLRVNIIFNDVRVDNVVKSIRSNAYWIKLSDKRYHWVKENDLDKALHSNFIPPLLKKKRKPKRTTTVKVKDSSDTLQDLCTIRPSACIGYLCRHIKDPKIDARNPIDTDPYHTYDISMLLISCKTLGQFMDEVQAFIPDHLKTPDIMDWYYLDDPDHEDTANDIKIKTWYTRQRAKCKVILSKLQLCYGGLQKNGYQFFLTNCFSKEFSKEVSKKSLQVTASAETKEQTEKNKVENPSLCEVQIIFDEEVSNG